MSDEIEKQTPENNMLELSGDNKENNEASVNIGNSLFNNGMQQINDTNASNNTKTLEDFLNKKSTEKSEYFENNYRSGNSTLDEIAKSLSIETAQTPNISDVINPATVGKADEIAKMLEIDDKPKEVSSTSTNPTFINPTKITLSDDNQNYTKPEEKNQEFESNDIKKVNSEMINPPDDVTVLTPTDRIVKVKVSKEDIDEYEKKEKEEEDKRNLEEDKKLEESAEEIKRKITQDLKENVVEDENVEVKITLNKKSESTSEDKTEIEDISNEKNNKKEIEYLGGDPKDPSSWPFIEKSNVWSKKYMKISEKDLPSEIVGQPLYLDENNFSEYIVQKNRFNALSMTKVPLPFSGLTLFVKSYKNSSLLKIMNELARWDAQRRYIQYSDENIENYNYVISEAYVKLRTKEFESIYKHVEYIYVVNKGPIEKPDMETFFKMIKYPDIPQLYYAIYHGTNKNKRKKYRIRCENNFLNEETGESEYCGTINERELYDEELLFGVISDHFTKNDFYSMIRDEYPKDRELPITKLANTELHRLTSTKSNIVQYVPDVLDYLNTLNIMLDLVKDPDVDFDYDLSLIDVNIPENEWNWQKYDEVKLLKTYLYTKRVDFLWLVNDQTAETTYKTISVDNNQKREIFDVLIDLPFEDMLLLTKGKEIKDMMLLKAIEYFIPETKCSTCGKMIPPTAFDVRLNFFTLLSEMRKQKE